MLKGEQIRPIPLDDLIPSPGNRRIGGFDPDKLQQLADSIQAVGVQQPIVVRPNGQSKFEIVAGERRWKAARIAGLLDIPAVVRDLDDVAVLKIQTIENLQREDIHPLDEANGYARLIEKAGYDVEHLAQEVGRSASYVYQRLKLQDLVPKARDMLVEGEITSGHAILIARLQPAQQEELAKYIKDRSRWNMVSVRELDDFIHRTILLDLNRTAFKKDDPDLDPATGPCTTCPKRTGYQPALFADVCNGGKRDYCTDPPCFNGKLAALVQRRRMEFKESGEAHLEVMDGYGIDYREEQRLKKAGVKERYGWEECKKKDEGAVKCLIVAGNSPGRITYGRERKTNQWGGYQSTEAEKREAKKKRQEEKIKKVMRRRIWEGVFQTLYEKRVCEDLPVYILRMIAATLWKRTWNNLQKLYCETMGWERPPRKPNEYGYPSESMGTTRIATMDKRALFHFLLGVSLINELEGPGWQAPDCEKLKQIGDFYEMDIKSIEAAVKQEFAKKEAEAKKRAAKKKAKTKKAKTSAK